MPAAAVPASVPAEKVNPAAGVEGLDENVYPEPVPPRPENDFEKLTPPSAAGTIVLVELQPPAPGKQNPSGLSEKVFEMVVPLPSADWMVTLDAVPLGVVGVPEIDPEASDNPAGSAPDVTE